ncbi:hypothetical protein EDB84DRAFT_1554901 [Lactarius hengduanensis]|nr:hypothetical protein EDB84DRAFT_1554901 [Lactarius hengduanensis]
MRSGTMSFSACIGQLHLQIRIRRHHASHLLNVCFRGGVSEKLAVRGLRPWWRRGHAIGEAHETGKDNPMQCEMSGNDERGLLITRREARRSRTGRGGSCRGAGTRYRPGSVMSLPCERACRSSSDGRDACSKISREPSWLRTARRVRCSSASPAILALLLRPLLLPLPFAIGGDGVRRYGVLKFKRSWRPAHRHRQRDDRQLLLIVYTMSPSPSSSTSPSLSSLTVLSACNAAPFDRANVKHTPRPGNVNGCAPALNAPCHRAGDGGALLCAGDSCGNLND